VQRDCGKFAGDGRNNSSTFIDDWIFAGLVDANSLKLDCAVADVMDTDSSNHLGVPVPMMSSPDLVALLVTLFGLAAAGTRRIKASDYQTQS